MNGMDALSSERIVRDCIAVKASVVLLARYCDMEKNVGIIIVRPGSNLYMYVLAIWGDLHLFA